jgi:hypothetical protein
MTAVPDWLAAQTAGDEHPATLDISGPCPTEVAAAVECLWLIVRQLRADVDTLTAQLPAHT